MKPKSSLGHAHVREDRHARRLQIGVRSVTRIDKPGGGNSHDIILVVLFLLGTYIDFNIKFTDSIQLPFPIAFGAGCALLVRHAALLPNLVMPSVLALVALLTFLMAWNFMFSSYFSQENVYGTLQLMYSIFSCMGLFIGLISISRQSLKSVLWWSLVLLIVVSTLEVYTPLRAVSNAFREAVYSDMAVYFADERDLTRYGGLRPKAFAREPSFVGQFYTMLTMAWLILRADRFGVACLLAGIATLIGLFVIRSPIVTAIIPLTACFLILRREIIGANRRAGSFKSLILLAIAITSMFLVASLATALATHGLFDASIFVRIVAPVYAFKAVLGEAPLLGAGLGVEEALTADLAATLMRLPVVRYIDTTSLQGATYLFINSFFGIWMALGLLGGVTLFVILERFLKRAQIANTFFVLICAFIIMNSSGGTTTIKVWLFFFLMAAVIRHVEVANVGSRRLGRPSAQATQSTTALSSNLSRHPYPTSIKKAL